VTPASSKLIGAWVSKVPGFPFQWTTMFAPIEPSGHRAAIWGTLEVPVPAALVCKDSPAFISNSDFTGEAVMTGPNTAKVAMIGYSMNEMGVALSWVTEGEITFTGPGKAQSTFTIKYYKPEEADRDGDGIPEGEPFCTFTPPLPTIDTRIGVAIPPVAK